MAPADAHPVPEAAELGWRADLGRDEVVIAGRYTLEREVGRGGMGAVWLARDEVLGRAVALKPASIAPGSSANALARAEREARLAARLSHRHVVAVYALVTEGSEQWLVMDYVEAVTLAVIV